MKVQDCMCGDICVCSPENTVCDCSKLMNNRHVGCVPVCDAENKVVGLVTDRDIILRCIACDKDPKNTKISEIMTTNVCCCKPEQDVCDAEQDMCETQVRRIPVVDNNNKIIGMLSLGDLAKNNNVSKEDVGKTVEGICDCATINIKNCR